MLELDFPSLPDTCRCQSDGPTSKQCIGGIYGCHEPPKRASTPFHSNRMVMALPALQ
jgi:hypothetical protein